MIIERHNERWTAWASAHAHCTCESIYAYHTPGPMNDASDPMLRHILEWHKILLYTEYEDYTHKYSDRGLKLNSRADDRIKFKPPWVQMGIACDDFI